MGLPDFLKLTDQNLEYRDVLVYTALKWFNDDIDSLCFPMHDTVGKLAGVSKNFVISSIKRLEAANIIRVKRSKQKNKSNYYYFAKPWCNNRLVKIHKGFFEMTSNLSSCEKAMLLCLRQFFNHFRFECHIQNPLAHFAEWLGLSKDQVRKQFSLLIKKEYIKECFVISKRRDKARSYYKLTDKVDWDFSEYENRAPLLFNKLYKPAMGTLKIA